MAKGITRKVIMSKRNPNSDATSAELRKQGKCTECGGRGLWTSFGTPGVYRSVKCRKCGKGG